MHIYYCVYSVYLIHENKKKYTHAPMYAVKIGATDTYNSNQAIIKIMYTKYQSIVK